MLQLSSNVCVCARVLSLSLCFSEIKNLPGDSKHKCVRECVYIRKSRSRVCQRGKKANEIEKKKGKKCEHKTKHKQNASMVKNLPEYISRPREVEQEEQAHGCERQGRERRRRRKKRKKWKWRANGKENA